MLQSIRSAFAVLIFGLLIVSIVDLPEFVTQRFFKYRKFYIAFGIKSNFIFGTRIYGVFFGVVEAVAIQ